MDEEPAAMKFFRALVPWRQKPDDPLLRAQGLSRSNQAQLIDILSERRQSAPVIVHLLKTLEDKIRIPLDTAVLLELAKKYKAGAEVVEGITLLERGMYEHGDLPNELRREQRERERKNELAEGQHDVAMLEIDQRKTMLRSPLPRQVEEARMIGEIEKLTGSREETTLKMWKKLIKFHRDDLRGMDIFKERSDKDIEGQYQEMLAAIPPDAPNREALERAAKEARDELRRRRDRLIADMARHLADKLASDRRKKEDADGRT